MSNNNNRKPNSGRMFGWLMIGLGALLVIANIFGGPGFLARALWPLWVVGFGAAIFVIMVALGKNWGWLAVPGGVTVTTGLLLFYANLSKHWISWTYSWTLLVAAFGLGLLISHYWSGKPRSISFGSTVVKISLVSFAAGALLVEVIIGAGRQGVLGGFLWPLALVALGVYLITRGRRGDALSAPRIAPSIEAGNRQREVEFEPLKTDVGKDKEQAR